MSTELSRVILDRKATISYPEIQSGILDQFIASGLQVIALCEYGVRSNGVATYMTARYLPTLSLIQGLMKLRHYENHESRLGVTASINRVPIKVAILTEAQYGDHAGVLSQFTNIYWYQSEYEAGKAFFPDM
jgi:hypothetical protein